MNVFVACPANTVTGGIELLHQLCHELDKLDGINAYIWNPLGASAGIPQIYAMEYKNKVGHPTVDDFSIFPEIWSGYANVMHGKSAIFWESVDNYFPHTDRAEWFKFKDGILHISQSEYSRRFLENVCKIPKSHIINVADYVNNDFLTCDIQTMRKRRVLYNPAKGMEYTEKLIALAPDNEFVPIHNMERHEIIRLMQTSMVWVDFGNFPGRDRLPREAGACGMCLITGRHGSSKYYDDLRIPYNFRLYDVNYSDLSTIVIMLKHIFDDFPYYQSMFSEYRSSILKEKDIFIRDVRKLAQRLQS